MLIMILWFRASCIISYPPKHNIKAIPLDKKILGPQISKTEFYWLSKAHAHTDKWGLSVIWRHNEVEGY